MASAAILATNLADSATLGASSSVADMGVGLLISSPHVWDDKWRSSAAGYGWVQADLGSNTALDTVALFGLNLSDAATIRVRVSTEAGGGSSGDLHDETYDVGDAEFDPDLGAFVLPLAAPVSGRYVLIDLTDASLAYVEAGRLVIGLREALTINFPPGAAIGWTDPSVAERSRGRQTQIWQRPAFRTATIPLPWVASAQRWGLLETIGRVNGVRDDILLMLDPASDNIPQWSIWGRATVAAPAFTAIADYFGSQMTIEERR